MRRFSNVQALLYSFFSRDVYRDAAGLWKGAGILYVLMLATIVSVWTAGRIQSSVSRFSSRAAPGIIEQLPTFTVENGRLSVDRPTPIHVRDPASGKVLAIIDTTGEVTGLEDQAAAMLVTSDRIVFRKSEAETRAFELASVKHFVLTRERVTGWVRKTATWLAPLLLPFILAGMFVWRMVQLLVVSLAALGVARIRGVALDFGAAMRISALAMTPATLALDTAGFLGGNVPAAGWLWCAITVFYVVFAVNACRPEPAATGATPAPPA